MNSVKVPNAALCRRTFCVAGAFGLVQGRPSAQVGPTGSAGRIKFAVIGINHEHIFRMVETVRAGGGELVSIFADSPDPDHATRFFTENSTVHRARSEREIFDDSGIALVVSAAKPRDRLALGLRVMRAGKDFLCDKGCFLDLSSIDEARSVQAETKRIFSISYNERLLDAATVRAGEIVRSGAIGRVLHTSGFGPHGLSDMARAKTGFGCGPSAAAFFATLAATRPTNFFSLPAQHTHRLLPLAPATFKIASTPNSRTSALRCGVVTAELVQRRSTSTAASRSESGSPCTAQKAAWKYLKGSDY